MQPALRGGAGGDTGADARGLSAPHSVNTAEAGGLMICFGRTAGHETGAAGSGCAGYSNPRYATGGNGTAHRTPTAGALRADIEVQ